MHSVVLSVESMMVSASGVCITCEILVTLSHWSGPLQAPPPPSSQHRFRSALVALYLAMILFPLTLPRWLAAGRDPTQTDTPDGHVAREPGIMQDGPTRIPVDSGSTLLVPGSLFVGRGLGLKKTPAWVPPEGSAKDMLKRIMENGRD